MLINQNIGGKTPEGYRKALKLRIAVGYAMIVLSIAVFLTLWIIKDGTLIINDHDADYLSGFYTGIATGFFFVGVVTIIKNRRTLKDPEKFSAAFTACNDERTQFILMKTYQTSAIIMEFGLFLAAFVAGLINITVYYTLLTCAGVFGIILTVLYRVLQKKY